MKATKRLVQATIEQCAGNKLKAARHARHSAAHHVSAFFQSGRFPVSGHIQSIISSKNLPQNGIGPPGQGEVI